MSDRSSMDAGRRVWHAWPTAGLLALLTLAPLLPAVPRARAAVARRGQAVVVRPAGDATAATAATPTGTGTSSAQATATATSVPSPEITATPRPTAAPTISAYPRTLPRPTIHRTNGYEIGAYYFSGWSHGQNDNLTPLLLSSPLRLYEPLIGWYDDSQRQVDQTIVQAAGAGIDFFAFDWYDTLQSRFPTDQSLNEALGLYLSSRQRYRLNFCLTFVDQAPFLPRARDWPRLVKSWIAYFKQPDYVRVNGKPLFIVFSPEHMRDIFGTSRNVHTALDYLRGQVQKAGLPGLTIAIGTTLTPHYNPARIAQLLSEGYDVSTGYNYHAVGGEAYRKPVPYARLMQENEQMWDRVARLIRHPYIPVITAGWDQRFSYREQQTAIIYAGRTPAQFYCYAAAARRWVNANAQRTVKEKIVLVFAWNEIGEGGMIIPTQADRYGYTTALHAAFSAVQTPACSSGS